MLRKEGKKEKKTKQNDDERKKKSKEKKQQQQQQELQQRRREESKREREREKAIEKETRGSEWRRGETSTENIEESHYIYLPKKKKVGFFLCCEMRFFSIKLDKLDSELHSRFISVLFYIY